MEDELKKIKKLYGEDMMHLCRKLFPDVLEETGRLYSILINNFLPTKSLSHDIKENMMEEDFKDFILSFTNYDRKKVTSSLTPYELLKKVGYHLEECKMEEDIQKYTKYYKENEKLCTFNGGRLNNCYVFFAVHENANKIRREDFKHPKRQDEYGTSVISIQFSRGKNNTVSIKNRYNSSVRNPDATYSCNLENIIPGLTDSFEKTCGFNIDNNKVLSDYFLTYELKYVKALDGRYYRFNNVINDIYYCENNIIIDHGKVINNYYYAKERYILMDYFILDLKEKKIYLYDKSINDSFISSINNLGIIEKIKVISDGDNKIITISYQDNKSINIILNKSNGIISYENNYINEIGDSFLKSNMDLESIRIDNTIKIGKYFLEENETLCDIDASNVIEIEDLFLFNNRSVNKISFPKLEIMGNNCLGCNKILEEVNLPRIRKIGMGCFEIKKLLGNIDFDNHQDFNNYVTMR